MLCSQAECPRSARCLRARVVVVKRESVSKFFQQSRVGRPLPLPSELSADIFADDPTALQIYDRWIPSHLLEVCVRLDAISVTSLGRKTQNLRMNTARRLREYVLDAYFVGARNQFVSTEHANTAPRSVHERDDDTPAPACRIFNLDSGGLRRSKLFNSSLSVCRHTACREKCKYRNERPTSRVHMRPPNHPHSQKSWNIETVSMEAGNQNCFNNRS